MNANHQRSASIAVLCFVFFIESHIAQAGEIFNAKCTYSHTLPDDSIVHYGQPGVAMVHDFFGNTGTDAYSDYSTLNANKVTTCESPADLSAYWVPQLKRASGIVVPDFTKTYYVNDNPVVPLQPIPAGLEMLAGDHMGTAPNPNVLFFCQGTGYSHTAPTSCPVNGSSGAQLDISVHFPDCWDGSHLKPDYATHFNNVTYRQSDGTCPAGYPVRIPQLQLNVQYSLGQDPDLSTAQLSMDPMLENGSEVPMWGSLYTAHADFISAWKTDTMLYGIELCGNANVDCGNKLPTYYSQAIADASSNASGTVTANAPTLTLGPGDTVFLKIPTPARTTEYPWTHAYLQTQGQNTTDTAAIMLNLYAATTEWNETSTLPQAADCSKQSIGGIYLDNENIRRLNDVTSYVKSEIAAADPMIGVCIRNTTGRTVVFSSREGVFTPALFLQ
jgi:hypothetical protein